jgi:carnitine 3-dehydrogenase
MSGSPAAIRRLGLLGGGVIGAAWAARAVLHGIDAVILDPDPDAQRKTQAVMDNARRAWTRLTMATLPEPGTWRVTADLADALHGADFVQESLPEREALKQSLLVQAEHHLRPETIIASSTSGLLPSRLQSGLRHPERFVVGHPFNPVYLMPLVEIVGGDRTTDATRQHAAAFYRRIGMRPLLLRREIDGFVADRLMEALWREALWLLHDDIATAEEIDDAIRFGPGLRWAFMGTFLIYRIAGGEPGMRHFMAQFGPSLKWPWTKLMDTPALDDTLLEKIVAQSDAQGGHRDLRGWERLRDDCLIGILQSLKAENFAAGEVLAQHEAALGATVAHDAAWHGRVEPGWIDYNGHMTESRYLQVLSHASDALLARIGADPDYVAAGHSYFTAETHIRHLGELRIGDPLRAETQILGCDDKRLHIFTTVFHAATGVAAATGEQMLLHVDMHTKRVQPALPHVLARLRPLAAADARKPRPDAAGRAIAMPLPAA